MYGACFLKSFFEYWIIMFYMQAINPTYRNIHSIWPYNFDEKHSYLIIHFILLSLSCTKLILNVEKRGSEGTSLMMKSAFYALHYTINNPHYMIENYLYKKYALNCLKIGRTSLLFKSTVFSHSLIFWHAFSQKWNSQDKI